MSSTIALANSVNLKNLAGEEYYFIQIKMNKINNARDNRIASVRAKSQLAKYLKKQSGSIVIDLKHFSLVEKVSYQDEVIFTFKIKKDDVQVLSK
ncbi:hypothetical protein Q7458_07265 [Glaesserella parasuis]|uniref:hypothetical protein n=1 Tax=Glaesserella parasuis TaxID=738 RepID=UPI0019D0F7B6|nr:hypothetical protein [Glaesserella parasuis]MDO9799164.1 hypothetical protein [Glaesserella parasuis]MDO9851226.1 hypothetical protein [Glaesserella parasuis]MDO9865284.1 hypothetical protein [Glaesserella parasuis]MDO9884934.1 hypothetical protein [Glaesserella parasuis]